MKNLTSTLFFIGSLLLLSSCGNSEEENKIADEERQLDSLMSLNENVAPEISDEVVHEIMQSIPSPLEIASLIKESGAPYAPEILNDPDNADNYTSIYTKALNLGIYGADMGYINLYEKPAEIFNYLGSIRGLSDDLKVGHFFDFSTLKRLSSKSDNLDSLLYISTSSFEEMNRYLKDNKRGNISLLILVGGWLEALHVATEVAVNVTVTDNEKLIERIGEQKIVLDEILLLLSLYEMDPRTKEIKDKFDDLKLLFDEVKIIYIEGEIETKEVDGMLVVIDTSESTVELGEELLNRLSKKINNIRNQIIK